MRNSLSGLCFCLGLLFATTLAAQRTLEQTIPATAHFVLQFDGLAGCRKSWREHGLSTIIRDAFTRLDDGQRGRLLRPWRREIAPHVRRLLRRIDLSPATVRALLRGPCAVVVGRPTVASGMLLPSVAILLDASDAEASANRVMARIAGMAGPERSREEVIQGVATRVVRFDNPGVDRIYGGIGGQRLVISNSRGLYAEILQTARGRGRSLASMPAYRSGRKHLRGRALASVWINTQPLMAAARPFLPYEADSISRALGVGELRGVFLGVGTDDGLGTEVCHIGLRGSVRGLLRAPIGKPVSLDFAALASPDTVAFAAMRLDPSALLRGLHGILAQMPGWIRGELERELGPVVDRIDRIDQIGKRFGVLTGDFAVACSMPKPLPIPEVTLFVGIRNQDQVTQELRHLMARVNRDSMRTQTFLDVDIHHITASVDGIGIAPCFACKDGVLMISTHPRILKATLRRWQKKAPGLRDRPDWKDVARRARGCHSILYVATGELARRLVAVPQVSAWLRTELHKLGVDPNILPEADDLGQALGSIVITSRADRDGFTLVSRSPVFEGSLFAAAGYVVDRALRELIGRQF